jgi:hypothetical protein
MKGLRHRRPIVVKWQESQRASGSKGRDHSLHRRDMLDICGVEFGGST